MRSLKVSKAVWVEVEKLCQGAKAVRVCIEVSEFC